jgi:hypothetical protein
MSLTPPVFVSVCLCVCLSVCVSLEVSLQKLDAERRRMDELTTRDAANEAKFAALSKTLEMLVKGETQKTLDGERKKEKRPPLGVHVALCSALLCAVLRPVH